MALRAAFWPWLVWMNETFCARSGGGSKMQGAGWGRGVRLLLQGRGRAG